MNIVAILLDTKYAGSMWCRRLYTSLTERLREKRIPFCEIFDTCPRNMDAVFVIGSDLEWTSSAIKQLNAGGVTPILLCNQTETLPGCLYNCVCSDISASMKTLLDVLQRRGKRRIAVYGVNPDSIPDISRADSLLRFKGDGIEQMTLFQNHGSLQSCFESFFPYIQDFDAVVCTNDFAAISLVKKLGEQAPEWLETLAVASCARSSISGYYRSHILSLDINYDQYGKAAVYMYEALQKHSYLSGLVAKVAWTLEDRPENISPAPIALHPTQSRDAFYDDPELQDLLVADKLLTLSDETDRKILAGLRADASYEEIAGRCYLSVNAVKYRIKKLLTDSGAEDRHHMLRLLKQYIPL